MKKAIWKFDLKITDVQEVAMPQHAEILTAQMQGEKLCLWALVDPANRSEYRSIEIIGTGNSIESGPRRYIGTTQMAEGRLVWHVFELLRL